MKKIIKKIIILLLILGGGYFGYKYIFSSKDSPVEPGFGKIENLEKIVEKKDFKSSISLQGTTKIKNEQKLRFNTAGRITEVNFKVGDEIKLGQILAKIDSSEIDAEIEKARINLENTRENLKKFVDDIKDTGIKKANLDIDSMKLQLDQKEYNINYLEKKQKKLLSEASFNLKEAKNNYEISLKESQKNISNLGLNSGDRDRVLKEKELQLSKETIEYNNFKSNFNSRVGKRVNEYYSKLETNYLDIESKLRDIEKSLEEAEKLVGLNSDGERFDYDTYFSAKKSIQIGIIKSNLFDSSDKYRELKKSFSEIKDKKDADGVIKALEKEQDFYKSFYKTANSVSIGYKESISSDGFNPSSGELNYLGKANEASSKIISLTSTIDDLKTIDSVEKIKKDLENELENKRQILENLKIEIKKTKENQDYIVGTSDNNILAEKLKMEKLKNSMSMQEIEFEKLKKNQKEELEQEKISLEKLKLDYKNLLERREELLNLSENTEYKLKQNSVKQSEVSLEDSKKKLENYILKAPFDGKISKIDISVGDRLNSDTQQFISVVDPNSIEINISINQSDIVKIKKGMKTEIKLNSYADRTFSGSVFEVDTTPKEENGIIKFNAKILLERPKDIEIYSGLKADVTIIYGSIENAIVVPFTSVESSKDGNKYVTVIGENGNKEKREVEVGFTDGKNYEIKSGLKVGEKVLEIDYSGANNFADTKNQIDGFNQGEIEIQSGEMIY